MISHIMSRAQKANVRLRAQLILNERNRVMYVTYKFGSFKQVGQTGDLIVLEKDRSHIQSFPEYVQVRVVKRQERLCTPARQL